MELLAALAGGAGGEIGWQAWTGLTALVRRPLRDGQGTEDGPAVRSGEVELAELERAPADPACARALSTALVVRAAVDADFRTGLERWHEQAQLVRTGDGQVDSTISGDTFNGPVLLGRDISGVSFAPAPPGPTPAPPAPAAASRSRPRNALRAELTGVADSDPHSPAGIGRAVENRISGGVFFHAVIQGRDITVQLPPQITPALSGLPAASVTFTGRDEQVEELLGVLAPGADRPQAVLVAGLAGVGKTELVLQTAAQALRRPGWFPGGVLFLDMFGYDPERRLSHGHALDGLLRALGMPGEHLPVNVQDRSRLYRSILANFAEQGRRILVVIDNVSTADQARPLLPADGTTAALLTSRHTLDLDARLHDLDILDEHASVELLRQALLRARGAADTRVDDAPEQAATIARLCGGLPLALRIAAAQLADISTRPLASLAGTLEAAHTRLDRLRREDRAVRAAFDLSYQRVSDDHARLFRLLPLNAGPDLSTESAAYLAGIDQYRTEELLQDLTRAHLIAPGPTWGRWRMHDLVRLFADELGETQALPDGRGAARERLLDWYVATAREADERLSGVAGTARFPNRAAAVSWLETERPNLVASARAAEEHGLGRRAFDLAQAQGDFLVQYRHLTDALDMADTALAAARAADDAFDEARALHSRGLALTAQGSTAEAITAHQEAVSILNKVGYDGTALGYALSGLGIALLRGHRPAAAVEVHERSLKIFRGRGERHGEAQALTHLGAALFEAHRLPEARQWLVESVALLRGTTDLRSLSMALNGLGQVLRESADFEAAIEVHREEAEVDRALGDRHAAAIALTSLGSALWASHRFEEAIAVCTESAHLFEQLDDPAGQVAAGNNLGVAQAQLLRYDDAVRTHRAVLEMCETLDDPGLLGDTLVNLALATGGQGDREEALKLFDRARAVLEPHGDGPRAAHALLGGGQTLMQLERHAEAVPLLERAVELFTAAGDRRTGGALGTLSEALWHLQRYDEAQARHQECVAALRGIEDHRTLAGALTRQFFVEQQSGATQAAVATGTEVVTLYQDLGDRVMEASIRTWLGALFKGASCIAECREQWLRALEVLPPGANPDLETGLRLDLDQLPPDE